jgi:hypothetical protein
MRAEVSQPRLPFRITDHSLLLAHLRHDRIESASTLSAAQETTMSIHRLIHLASCALLLCSLPALADDPPADEEAPPPPVILKHIPPRFSYEGALSAGYGMMPQFVEQPHWMFIGGRGGWGKHYGAHRIGVGLSFTLEGAVTVEWANVFEPQVLYDHVDKKGLWVGASLGPSLMINSTIRGETRIRNTFDTGPMVAFRIGYSQPWSMTARRFFVGIEPKLRIVDNLATVDDAVTSNLPAVSAMIVIGSGMGY